MRLDRKMVVTLIPVTVDETNIQKGAYDILKVVRPSWTCSGIKSKVFTDGLSNKLVGFFIQENPEDMVIVKVFGSHTGKLIDRKAEIETMRILHERNCGAQLYATFNNGICYEFMNGSTLEPEDCSHPDIYPLVAQEMARMHSNFKGSSRKHNEYKTSPMWQKMLQFNKLAEDSIKNDPTLKTRLEGVGVKGGWALGAINDLKCILEAKNMPITFCHNDLCAKNIVYDGKRHRVTFIDVEYAAPNYPAFDVANHFIEFAGVPELDYSKCPNKEFRVKWITEYLKDLRLGNDMIFWTLEEFNEWVDLCTPASHLFWGLWAIHQAKHSTIDFDYVAYVGKRFKEFEKCMVLINSNIS